MRSMQLEQGSAEISGANSYKRYTATSIPVSAVKLSLRKDQPWLIDIRQYSIHLIILTILFSEVNDHGEYQSTD